MAQLIVRNLEDDIVKRLRRRAAESGRSVEAEHREILRDALLKSRSRKSLKQHLLEMPNAGRDEDLARKQDKARKVRL
jgi:plasmid stability protein